MPNLHFLDAILIDIPHTLSQLLSRFSNVRNGLPELVKNSKDQYSALGVQDPAARAIVVLVDSDSRRIGVLDFAGASRRDFDRWKEWSRRPEERRELAEDIEAGHGNGGKAFMVYGSASTSFIESVTDGRRTKIGFVNNDEEHRFRPGYYVEEGLEINDAPVSEPAGYLVDVLAGFGMSIHDLPEEAQEQFELRDSFTFVQIDDVASWRGRHAATVRRLIAELPQRLVQHPQAALTIESCTVWVVVDGVCRAAPLTREYPDPMEGFEEPVRTPVPAALLDPETGESVSSGLGDPETKYLELRTSRASLRMPDSRPLNVIRVRNARNVVATWSVADLYSRAESAFLLGELRVPALDAEYQSGAEWDRLVDTPLTRALEAWTADQVEALAQSIQAARARDHRSEELDTANEGLRELRDLMREFLEDADGGTEGGGRGDLGEGADGEEVPPDESPPPASRVDEVVLESGVASIAMASGTRVPILVRAYEIRADGERRAVPLAELELQSDSEELGVSWDGAHLSAVRPGRGLIWFVAAATSVASNRVLLDVAEASGAEFQEVPERLLLQGERLRLRPVLFCDDGPRQDLLLQASVDEGDMGRINRHGVFTAGTQPGTVTIRLRYGSDRGSTATATLHIGTDRVAPTRRGDQEGGELPLILLCGTEVPGMETFPEDQRTIRGGDHQPTIIDFEPEFEHVIFINPDSKESVQVRQGRGGRRGTMGIGAKTYLQFLALKCFEILKRLWVRQTVEGGHISELQFRQLFASAETECAPFIERAYDIAQSLTGEEADDVA